jgi:hypothetical protein
MQILDPLIKCAICGKPISLEQSKVSEDGKPVHEECYVRSSRRKSPGLGRVLAELMVGRMTKLLPHPFGRFASMIELKPLFK